MINGLQGIPGSGKSYEAVAFHVLEALKKGRKVVTNLPLQVDHFAAINPEWRSLIEIRFRPQPIRGTWDAARVDDEGNGNAIELFEDGHVEQPDAKVRPFGHVWDFYSEWKHPKTKLGPLFIIDECHIAFPKLGTDSQVIEYFKLHRHFNADVLLMTQNFRDMNQDIAGLIAILVKCRKADVLGKSDSYIRNVHAGYRGGQISSETREYKPEYFPLYKSHTQGNSVGEAAASDVAPLMVKFRRAQRVVWFIALVVVGWAVWMNTRAKPAPKPANDMQQRLAAATEDYKQWEAAGKPGNAVDEPRPVAFSHGPAAGALDAPAAASSAPIANGQPPEMPEPFKGRGLHMTGRITMGAKTLYTFAISNNAIYVASVTSDDLVMMGYTWSPIGDCSGSLAWKRDVRAVTCDAPRAIQAELDKT